MAYMSTRPRGLGEYDQTANWSWMYYPPPYAFADPLKIAPPPGFYAPADSMGLGGCGCGCSGHGKCGGSGVGAALDISGSDSNFAGVAMVGAAYAVGLYLGGLIINQAKKEGRRRR